MAWDQSGWRGRASAATLLTRWAGDEVRVLYPGTAHVAYLDSAAVGRKLQAPPRGRLDEPQALVVASQGFDARELAGDPRFADPLQRSVAQGNGSLR
jgi:hypothetical protein